MSSTPNTVKVIKKDAIVPINIGAGFIEKLQTLMFTLMEGKTDDELEVFKKLSEKGEDLPESWMEGLYTVYTLLAAIQESADKNGFTVEKSIDEVTS